VGHAVLGHQLRRVLETVVASYGDERSHRAVSRAPFVHAGPRAGGDIEI
jgi:hypothetical protein